MRTAPPNTFTKGQTVMVNNGAREYERGIVVTSVDWLFQVCFSDRSTAWYGSDELEAV
jgi:hypothetical protein